MDNLALITWTNTEYSDIWPMYFGRLDKHLNYDKSYVFLNEKSDKAPSRHIQLINNEDEPYYKRFTDCLENVEEEYVLYMQEDHIFYEDCNHEELQRVFKYLKDTDYSNVRLIKSGELGGDLIDSNLFNIPDSSLYLFSQQSAIWKKDSLMRLMKFYLPRTYRDVEMYGSMAMKHLEMKACYYFNDEKKRGSLHFDSSIFPYVATAVCKAKWNLKQYPLVLSKALEEYNIDYSLRGLYEG